jgi:tetratricopeptide (TPR) repeat protein
MAEANFVQAREGVDRYYTTVSENRLLQQPGMQGLRKDLLDDALDYYQAFIAERADDPKLREELAAAHFRVGKITGETGSTEAAMTSLQAAADIQSALLKEQPDEPRFELALSNSWNEMGRLEIQRQQLPQAQTMFEQARDLRQKLVTRAPNDLEYQRKLANSFMNLGAVDGAANRLPEALKSTRQAIELHQQLTTKEPNNPFFRRDLAKAYYNLALLERRAGRPADALASCRKSLALYQQLYDEQPQVIEFQGLLTFTTRLADELAQESGRNADALAAYDDARRLVAKLIERNPLSSEYRAELAVILRQIGQRTAEPDQSLEAYRQAKDIWTQLARDNPAVPRYQADLAAIWQEIGQVEQGRQHFAEALSAFEQVLAIDRQLAAQFPNVEFQDALARAYTKVALIERALPDRLDAARAKLDEALKIYRALAASDAKNPAAHEGMSRTYVNLGLVADALKKPTDALEAYRQAIDEQRRAIELAPQVAGYRERLSKLYGELALIHRQVKRVSDAVAAGLEQQKLAAGNGPALIEAARSLVLTATAAQAIGPDQAPQVERARAAAVIALREAFALKAIDSQKLAADPDFASLQDRPDFQAIGK